MLIISMAMTRKLSVAETEKTHCCSGRKGHSPASLGALRVTQPAQGGGHRGSSQAGYTRGLLTVPLGPPDKKAVILLNHNTYKNLWLRNPSDWG